MIVSRSLPSALPHKPSSAELDAYSYHSHVLLETKRLSLCRELLHFFTVDSLFFNQSESYYTFSLFTCT